MTDYLPYGRHIIDDEDIAAVVGVLKGDWLTTGPSVASFEEAVAALAGVEHAVAVNSGTAALHCAYHALGIGPGDEVVVPAMTFAATANAVCYCGARPVFVDVLEDNLLIDPAAIEACITPKTKAIVGVDYAGHPCDWKALRSLADRHGVALVADACHSIGGALDGEPVGSLADISVFSFHPVKHITTGEGGMAVTANANLAARMRTFRNHGITSDAAQREKTHSWYYEMVDLGFNYRITDIQCALGTSQLSKLPRWIEKRNELAKQYDAAFMGTGVVPLLQQGNILHAYHLYIVRCENRNDLFIRLRTEGIGVNVHYIPVYLHPYYAEKGYAKGLCPVAEKAYGEVLTLPLWPGMEAADIERVVQALVRI